MGSVETLVTDTLHVLELLAIVLALLVTAAIGASIVRSIWRVTFGSATLVLPFSGSESAAQIHELLAQQLGRVEHLWQQLSREIKKEEGAIRREAVLVDLGARGRAVSDRALDAGADQVISDQPIGGQAIGPISLGGVSVSPETVFALFYRLRSVVARRTIRGTLHEFGDTARLAASFTYAAARVAPRRRGRTRSRPGDRTTALVVVVRDLGSPRQWLDLVDDLAFRIVKARVGFTSEAESWSAYRAFLEGYAEHVRFLRTGDVTNRDRAIELYGTAVEAEPGYCLAHYNLANLLYNRYSEKDNEEAIQGFRAAAETSDRRLRGLALAGLALAYSQNVHRFGLGSDPWVGLAAETSQAAVRIEPDLEETNFAQAWAYQVAGRIDDAIRGYEHTANLPGSTPIERQIKSFAQNNRAWLCMTELGDLDLAESILREALNLYPNKMIYANLGEIHKRRGEFEDALADYEKARDLDPGYANAINETGMVYLAMAAHERDGGSGRVDRLLHEAERWHRQALDTLPADATHQREDLQARFRQARAECGFAAKSAALH